MTREERRYWRTQYICIFCNTTRVKRQEKNSPRQGDGLTREEGKMLCPKYTTGRRERQV